MSVIKRCPLLGANFKKIATFGTKCFVRYLWHVRYWAVSLFSHATNCLENQTHLFSKNTFVLLDIKVSKNSPISSASHFWFYRCRSGTGTFQAMESEELPQFMETHDEILDKSAFELYKMYFDDDIEEQFVRYCNLYARQKNDHKFSLRKQDLWDLMTIITISSYKVRPCFPMHWSLNEDIGLSLVRCLMSQNLFTLLR